MSTKERDLQEIGRTAFECIAEMVAALECDYERLEELHTRLADVRATNASTDETGQSDSMDPDEIEELAELEKAAGECENREQAEQRIHEDPLSIELSGTWTLGETPTADKAIILLGTGGPAVRIVCDLDGDMQPQRAYLQTQDWGTPWTDYIASGTGDTLLTYCQQFYFGEG